MAREIFTVRTPTRERPAPEAPSLVGLAVTAGLAAAVAFLFSMPAWTGPAFVAGAVATRAAKNRRGLQQTLRALTSAVFLSYGPVTLVTAFPPSWRLVFFAVLVGSGIALYEWAAQH